MLKNYLELWWKSKMNIRHATEQDIPFLVRCNNSESKWVGIEEPEFFHKYIDLPYFFIAEENGKPCAFLLAMGPETDYDSKNFLWFCERMKDFVYIDRVIVDGRYRRQGMASRLYHELFESVPNKPIVCEVAISPPNEESIPFHERLGFVGVGVFSADGKKTCTMYLR